MSQETVWEVIKVPETFDEDEHDPYHERGVYPSGERMDTLFSDVEEAFEVKEHLEAHSPSSRFGEHDDPTENDMDDAPYRFIVNEVEVR